MNYETIADIYSANRKIREMFLATVNKVSAEEAAALPEGEKWTIQEITEHVSMVDSGAARICGSLLDAARKGGKEADEPFQLSPELGGKMASVADIKVEAPERVHPTGGVTIDDAVARMAANVDTIDAMQSDLERFSLDEHKFPHPFFGDMTAAEWLIVAGGHEMRHLRQIERILEKIRK